MILVHAFNLLVARYTDRPQQAKRLWTELADRYSEKGRHYHNLNHLGQVLAELIVVKDELKDLDAVLFALYYHDAIYKVLRKDNEEKSAVLAENRMISLLVPHEKIQACKSHILSTKSHIHNDDDDTNFFTDADLSILGQEWSTYATYCQQIRQEYSVYPDLVYIPGRKKVLEHFLRMNRIFKSEQFFQKYERQARTNIERELGTYNNS